LKKILSILLVLGLVVVTTSNGREASFLGATPSGKEAIVRVVRSTVADSLVADSVSSLLINQGYLDADIRLESDTVSVHAGDRAVLDRVSSVSGELLLDDIGRQFTKENVDDVLRRLLVPYRDDGYYYATATIQEVSEVEGSIELAVSFTSGPVLTVGSVSLVGLERTRSSGLRRFLSIDSGDTVSARNLQLWASEASSVDYVEFVRPIGISPLPGLTGADVVFQFVEKQGARIEGAAGYTPDDPAGLVWNLDLTLLNLFGGGRRAEIRSERRERGRNLFEVGYRQPLFVIGAGHIGGKVATRDYRDDFYEFGVDLYAESRIVESFDVGVNAGWKTVEPNGDGTGYRRFLAGFGMSRDDLDDPLNPRSGTLLRWQAAYAYRRYNDDSLSTGLELQSLSDARTMISVDWYQPLFGHLVQHLGMQYEGLETSEALPPLSELILIGGPGTIRGYRNEQFAAIRAVSCTFEPRLRFNAGYLFAFYDAAYTSNREPGADGVVTVERYIQSYGLGFSLRGEGRGGSRAVSLSLGWGDDAAYDEPRLSIQLESGL